MGSADWLPLALALRLGSIALALVFAARPGPSRLAALGGSCLASLVTSPRRFPCTHDR